MAKIDVRFRFPWLSPRKTDPEQPLTAPFPLGAHSNGEYFRPSSTRERAANALILRMADESSRRLGVDRRAFLASSLGMTTSLWVMNLLGGCGSSSSEGGYQIPDAGTQDPDLGCALLDTSDWFVFDVQTHHIDPDGPWRETNPGWASFVSSLPQSSCGLPEVECFGYAQYVEKVFIDSVTAVAALTTVPALHCSATRTSDCGNPLDNAEIAKTRDLVNALAKSQRVVNHCMIVPNDDLAFQLDLMAQVESEHEVAAWKCYTQFGPNGVGWWLDDPAVGIPFIEKARELGVKVICVHKGIPFSGMDPLYASAEDVGRAAKLFPDVAFVVYHSALWAIGGGDEGAYDEIDAKGVDTLIKSLLDNGIAPGSNVYAELGTTWRAVMADPIQAQHLIGKLVKYLGENNVLWGTDCIWYGSPQPLIESFRALTISAALQDQHGYPALDDALKKKILGLNAAKLYGVDPNAKRCVIEKSQIEAARRVLDGELGARRWAFQSPLGPRTRRELMALRRHERGRPG